MKNTFGNNLSVTLFGESHGETIGAVIDGMTPGIPVSNEKIAMYLSKRRPASTMDTPRVEPDHFQIVSGVFEEKTTGSPICIVILNENTKSKDYQYGPARPSHADYTAFCKFGGFEDYRGGGHFSGRITAALVAVGGILIPCLEELGIQIETHVESCNGITGEKEIEQEILRARENCDSVGGITAGTISGVPAGVGEPWFDSVEGMLSHALFSLGGVKGVSFGDGFDFAKGYGSEKNDAFRMENGEVVTVTNHNGGINGGITNGMPITFRCAVKPTPSISKTQKTVNFTTMENCDIAIVGRHDPAIIRRICPVMDAVCAITIADLLITHFGTDVLREGF